MKTFPDIDRLKATLDSHRPLDPAIVSNLREDLKACEVFHKLDCANRTMCDDHTNRPATPLEEAHQGGCFISGGRHQ